MWLNYDVLPEPSHRCKCGMLFAFFSYDDDITL
jgi:hypothetical protein